MQKLIVSVVGQDRPGILAAATDVMAAHGCNIENVSQTILQKEFAGIFIITLPDDLAAGPFRQLLQDRLAVMDMDAHIKPVDPAKEDYPFPPSEPFIITTKGPDRKGWWPASRMCSPGTR
jgi:glycine cleavage system transcriptional repressor